MKLEEKLNKWSLNCLGFDKVHTKPVTYSPNAYNVYRRGLEDCYKNCSKAKWEAWDSCVRFCSKLDGSQLTISSYNSMCFTAQFVFKLGDLWYLARLTRDHNHVTPIKNSDQIDKYFNY